MTGVAAIKTFSFRRWFGWILLLIGCALTTAVYWSGLTGTFLFDDYPNIVDNTAVQPSHASFPLLVNAALSSPSSEFKRPLASLTFAANYVLTGLNPYWMKLTNLVIHLLNGLLIFVLARKLIALTQTQDRVRATYIAAIIATGWLLLPINLTCVLYVVQRMESLANLFVLLGLIGYLAGRRRLLSDNPLDTSPQSRCNQWKGTGLCLFSVTIPTAVGLLAKETAAMLPLYAFVTEWALFGFQSHPLAHAFRSHPTENGVKYPRDRRLISLFVFVLLLPMIVGIAWLLPGLLRPESWATRNFTMGSRLLSEARVVVDYIGWTLLPTPDALSFYHDDFVISKSILTPWTTTAAIVALTCLASLGIWLRPRKPLVALGIALFLSSQLLTATILPLELVYEHRNYFASFGLLLAVVPPLIPDGRSRFNFARWTLLIGLLFVWTCETAITAESWGDPLKLAATLADRGPSSPRAQYELGRTYIIYSHYDPVSAFTRMAYAPLERAAAIPGSSILPEQALIFMNSRMNLPIKDAWWNSMIMKLRSHKPTVQDESSLAALTGCIHDRMCKLPDAQLQQAFFAALSHPDPSARLLAMYSDFTWNVMNDHGLGLRMAEETVRQSPNEPAYRITLIRMLRASGRRDEMEAQIKALKRLNIGGRLNSTIAELQSPPSPQ